MGNDLIKSKFDDIDEKIDFLIDLCEALQLEKQELLSKITGLETELEMKNETEDLFSKQEVLIQSRIDGLLTKLNDFSNSTPID